MVAFRIELRLRLDSVAKGLPVARNSDFPWSRWPDPPMAGQLLMSLQRVLTMPLHYFVPALIAEVIFAWFINRYKGVPESTQTILNVVLALTAVGMFLWLINTYVPMAGAIKGILNIVVVVAVCVGILQAVGLWGRVVGLWNNLINRQLHEPADSGTAAQYPPSTPLSSRGRQPDTPHATKI